MKTTIPFKAKGAKSRLKAFLNEKERKDFAVAMLKDVLFALSGSKIEKEKVTIITTSPLEFDLNSDWGLDLKCSVKMDERGLNETLNETIKYEKEPMLIIMADLPLIKPENINQIIMHEEEVVIAPGKKGGTNILFLRCPSNFYVSYYGLSFLEHIDIARARKQSFAAYSSFFSYIDIDEVGDLIELLIHGKGFSVNYLYKIGVYLSVDKEVSVCRVHR